MQCKKEEMKRDASMSEQEVTLFVDFYLKKKKKKLGKSNEKCFIATYCHTDK